MISFYDNKGKKIDLQCDSGISHFLPINVGQDKIGLIDDISSGSEKYSSSAFNLPKEYTGIYLPYYIFKNGTIDHRDTQDQRKLYYRNYTLTLDLYDDNTNSLTHEGTEFSFITEDNYIVGISKHLSDYMALGLFTPIETVAKNYYFMDFNELYTCPDNVRGNMCFYIVVIFFAFHIIFLSIIILIALLKHCGQKSDESFLADLRDDNAINKEENQLFGDVRVFEYKNLNVPYPNQSGKQKVVVELNDIVKPEDINFQMKDKPAETENVKTVENKGIAENTYPEGQKWYNIFYFIFFRNIYVTSLRSTSPFAPKYKSVSKFAFFIYLLLLIVVLCCVFIDQDLTKWSIENQGQLAGFIFIAVFSTNVALILLGLIYRTWKKDREEVIDCYAKGNEMNSLISRTVRSNIIKTVLLNCVNIGLAAILYYWSVGFCAVWYKWAHNLLILWLLALIADFVVAEICLELIIYFFYLCRGSKVGRHLLGFVLSIKNLRNYS